LDFAYLDDEELHALAGGTAQEWKDCDDARVLEIWLELLTSVLVGTLEVAAELDPDRSRDLDLTGHGTALMTTLFLTSGQGITVVTASEIVRQTAIGELPPPQAETVWREWVGAHGDPLRLLLRPLAALGSIRLTDEPLARLLGEVVPHGQEQNSFEAMARLPHRQVAEVLTVIGKHHPDKKTTKLARRAAYKAGTRRAQNTVQLPRGSGRRTSTDS